MDLELEISIKNVIRRIYGLIQYKDSGSVHVGEIENLEIAGEEIRKSREDPNGKIGKMLKDYSQQKHKHKKKEVKRLMVEMEEARIEVANLGATIDMFEETFRKYNVPKRSPPSEQLSPNYLSRLRMFMKTNWIKRAEVCRKNQRKSLIEWMQRLDLSNDQDKITFHELKSVLSHLGFRISKFLNEYFLLIMAASDGREELMATIYEVETMIRCLCVEENSNSVVIKTFVFALKYFDTAMSKAGPFSGDAEEERKEITFFFDEEEANDLVHQILIEVLRLEVSFSYPDLPMMVINEVFMAMASHLIDNVFENKLNGISAKIDGLKSDIQFIQDENDNDDNDGLKYFEQLLHHGVKQLWNGVDLKKERESTSMADEDAKTLDNDLSELEFCVFLLEKKIAELKMDKEKATLKASETAAIEDDQNQPRERLVQLLTHFLESKSSEDAELLPKLEEELAILKKRIEEYKKEAQSLRKIILNEKEETSPKEQDKPEIQFLKKIELNDEEPNEPEVQSPKKIVVNDEDETSPEEPNKPEEDIDYEEKVKIFLRTWTDTAAKFRRNGFKNFMELLRLLDQSDEQGKQLFDSIKALAIDVGIRLSRLIVEYFLLFADSDLETLGTRTQVVSYTIQCVCLSGHVGEESWSPLIDRFAKVIEFFDRKITVRKLHDQKEVKGKSVMEDSTEENRSVSFSVKEHKVLSSIFDKVMLLEISFCYPRFPLMLENHSFMAFEKFIREASEDKLNTLSLEINELRTEEFESSSTGVNEDRKRIELIEMFDSQIKDIWNDLNL